MENRTVWTKERVLDLIQKNDLALAKALLVVYGNQTLDERIDQTTRHVNGKGFNGRDAAFLTSIAQKLPVYNNRMTPRQRDAVRKILPKYWRQLLADIAAKGGLIQWPEKDAAEEPAVVLPETIMDAMRERLAEKAAVVRREAAEETQRMDFKFGAWA